MTPERIEELRDLFANYLTRSSDENKLLAFASEILDIAERFARIAAILEPLRALRADRDELRAERERTAWQPIDTAPKDGTEILALCRAPARDGDYYEAVRYLTDAPCWVTREGWMRHPTHWMPLPAGPGQGATDGN